MFHPSLPLLLALTISPQELFWVVGVLVGFLAGVLMLFASLKRWLSDEFGRLRRR